MGMTHAFDVAKLAADIAERGWMPTDLAKAAEVSNATVSRFMRGQVQTAKTAGKLARALGRPVRRYVVRGGDVVGA